MFAQDGECIKSTWKCKSHHSEESKHKISASLSGHKMWNNSLPGWNRGLPCSEETKKRISESKKGKPSWNKGISPSEETLQKIRLARAKQVITKEQRERISHSLKGRLSPMKGHTHTREHKRRISEALRGDKCYLWKGGVSFEPYCFKFNDELKERVRERDNRKCQLCGTEESGRKLDVHHIHYDKPNCDPDLIALCNKCNCKVNHNREYYEEVFMNNLRKRGLV